MDISIRHFLSMNRSRIAFMGEPYTTGKLISFCNEMKKNGLSPDENFLYVATSRFFDAGRECAEVILNSQKRPNAIITAYDEIAFGAMRHLKKNGVRIPEDIAFIGINNTPYSTYVTPSLTSVEIMSEKICDEAIHTLFQNIFDGVTEPHTIVFAPRLIVRDSTTGEDSSEE